MELETHFKWSFQTSVESVTQNKKELKLESILEVLEGIAQLSESDFTSLGDALDGSIGTMISLPSEWTEDPGSMVRPSIFSRISETSLIVHTVLRWWRGLLASSSHDVFGRA